MQIATAADPSTGEDGGNDTPSGLSGRLILGDVSPNKLRVKGRFTGNIAGGAASSITPAPAPPTRRLVRRSISSFDVAKTKYSGWSCKELMKKIAEINDDITDEKEKLSPSGLKEDMVRTLVRHDVALSMDRHSRLQHPDPAEGWDLVRNVTLQTGNFTDPKSRFGLRVDSKGPGTGAVIVKVSTKIEANVKAGDVVVAANGQIVFDVSTMKEIRSYDITAVTKLMKGTAGGHPLSVDVLRRRGGEKKVSTEQPMAEQPKATAGLSISASSRGRRRRRSADSEVMDQNAIVGGKRERIRPVSSTYSFSYSQSSGDDENRCDVPGLPLLQKDRAVDSDDDASDEEFDANDEDIINFRAPASRRKIQTSEFYLADDGDRIDDPSPRQIRAGGLKQVRLRSLLADQGNFGDGSVVSETDIDATRFECLVSQDLNDLAAQGLISLQRGNSGQDYLLSDLVKNGRIDPAIEANKSVAPALYALARALQKAGVLAARVQVYFGNGRTMIHFDYPFNTDRFLIKLSAKVVWYKSTALVNPLPHDSVGDNVARNVCTVCAGAETFAKGKTHKAAQATNINPHSSEPRPDGEISTSIICQLPAGTNREEATEEMLKMQLALFQDTLHLPLRSEFKAPVVATKTLVEALPNWRLTLDSRQGWNTVPVKLFAVDKPDKVFRYLQSGAAAALAVGVVPMNIYTRMGGTCTAPLIGNNLHNVNVQPIDSSEDVEFSSTEDTVAYFERKRYGTPAEIAEELHNCIQGHHPNERANHQQPTACAVVCTETNVILTAHRQLIELGPDLYGHSEKAENFGRNMFNLRTSEFHHNLTNPNGLACELRDCFAARLDEEEVQECEEAGLFELSGEEKVQALMEAGKWHDNPSQVLTCGCGYTASSSTGIKRHLNACTKKWKDHYHEKLGVKAFSAKKYKHLLNN